MGLYLNCCRCRLSSGLLGGNSCHHLKVVDVHELPVEFGDGGELPGVLIQIEKVLGPVNVLEFSSKLFQDIFFWFRIFLGSFWIFSKG